LATALQRAVGSANASTGRCGSPAAMLRRHVRRVHNDAHDNHRPAFRSSGNVARAPHTLPDDHSRRRSEQQHHK